MISYKDRSFCSSDCINTQCPRNYTDEMEIHNTTTVNLPVAFSDFSKGCDEYMSPEDAGEIDEDELIDIVEGNGG